MDKQYLFTDGKEVKNILFPNLPDEAWHFYSGAPEGDEVDLYASVAAVYRAANLNADTLAGLPFAIVNKAGNDIDTSDDWQNVVGFMPNPKELIRLWRLSMFATNSAYAFRETRKGVDKYRYIVPTSIEPVFDKAFPFDLSGFKRTVGTVSFTIPLSENRLFYMWRRDHTTELLPSKHTELTALLKAAGVIYYQDYFAEAFLKRGGILPTMLMVDGVPSPDERERIEKAWDKITRGVYKYLGKIFNAKTVEPKTIGQGMEALRDTELYESKLSDIAMAAGMPLSLLKANSANFATARVEQLQWFNHSIIPWSEFFAEVMNEQLFEPLGYRFMFKPEITDEGTEDEAKRAGAYRAYVDSGMRPSVAAQLVGIEMPDNMEYEELDESYDPDKEDEQESDNESTMGEADDVETPEIEEEKAVRSVDIIQNSTTEYYFTPSMEQYRELELWQTMAFRKCKRQEDLSFEFECKVIPDFVASVFVERLVGCETEDDIKAAFDFTQFTITPPPEFDESEAVSPCLKAAITAQVEEAQTIKEIKHILDWSEYP